MYIHLKNPGAFGPLCLITSKTVKTYGNLSEQLSLEILVVPINIYHFTLEMLEEKHAVLMQIVRYSVPILTEVRISRRI
jgi:hypothetical protein